MAALITGLSMRIAIISVLLWSQAVLAGSFTAALDKTRGTLDDQYVLTLTVNGKAAHKPQLPAIAGLEITSAGTSHSTSWVNGVVTREVSYRYVLIPTRTGTYRIPALQLEVDGEMISSSPLTLTVRKVLDPPVPGAAPRPLFITRSFAPTEAYVGEQIIETVKIFYRVKLLDATQQEVELLDFDVFKLGKERNYRQVVEGTTYHVIEVKRALIPLKAGEQLEVPRYVLNTVISEESQRGGRRGFFDDFFSMRQVRKRVSSPAAQLRVKALPRPPAGVINLEVVGDYRLSAAINKQQLDRSESATLTLFIEGYGNLRGIRPLALKFDNIKVYADKPTVKVRAEGQQGLYSQATLKLALQPLVSGELELSTVTFAWFHTPTGKFRTETVALGKLAVSAAPQAEQQVVTAAAAGTGKSAVAVLGADLITIHRGKALLVNHAFTPMQQLRRIGVAVLMLLVFAALWGYLQFLRPRVASRRAQAWRVFKKAQQQLDIQAGHLATAQLAQNFRTFLGDKLGMQGMSATAREIQARLQEQRLEESLCRRVEQHLQVLEKIIFAEALANDGKFAEMVTETNNLAGELERKC